MTELPPLREVIASHGLQARKSLGQNFLLDLNLTDKIVRAAGVRPGDTVVEVGPGPGGLTRSLLSAGARVVAIERDARCVAALRDLQSAYPNRLVVEEGDALDRDIAALVDTPASIVANLPYNIATPLLTGWITSEPWPPWFTSLTLMFQKEVAARIAARPDDGAYGRLSVLCGWRTTAELMFDLPARAFVPPPKVTSTVVRLTPRSSPLPCRTTDLETVTAAAFGQRRKMLRQSLKQLAVDLGPLLDAAGIDGTRRAEDVDVAGFVALANSYRALRTTPGPSG